MKFLLCAASARAISESAKKGGYDFVSLDFFGDIDTKEAGENHSLREYGDLYSTENLYNRSEKIDYASVVYGAGFENYPGLVEGFERRAKVVGNDSKTLRKVRNWTSFFSELENEGISFPKTDIMRAGDVTSSEGKLLKPIKSGGGHRIEGPSMNTFGADETVLLQEAISGTPLSTCIVGTGNRWKFLGATEQLLFDKYRYGGNISPIKPAKALKDISLKIGEIFGLKGAVGIDFISNKHGNFVLEVNPRLTGAMEVLEKAYDVNLFDIHVRACSGHLDFNPVKNGRYYSKKILYAPENLTFNICRMKNRPTFIKDVPLDPHIKKMSPICTIIGEGETKGACMGDLIRKENEYADLRQKNL